MKNYVVIGAGFTVLIVVCVAVIHYEGERTRAVMQETATRALKDGLTQSLPSAPSAEDVGDAVGKVRTILGETADTTAQEASGVVKPAAEAAREVLNELRAVASPRTDDSKKPPSTPAPSGSSSQRRSPVVAGILDEIEATVEEIIEIRSRERADQESKKAPRDHRTPDRKDAQQKAADGRPRDRIVIDPADPIGSVLEITRRTTKSGDDYGQSLLRLTPVEESAWGKKLHEEVIVESKVVRDSAVNKRLARVAAPILSRRKRPDIDYTITVLQSKSDDLNAFSLPGGYVYIHSALLDFVHDDAELQFVLAHEIAHVDLEHCNRKLTYAARASDLTAPAIGGFVGILHNIMSRPYAKEEEFEADAYALRACVAAGQSRSQALSFPRRFGEYLKNRDAKGRSPRETSVLSDVLERAEDHFSTHPPMDERIARLEAVEVDEGYAPAK